MTTQEAPARDLTIALHATHSGVGVLQIGLTTMRYTCLFSCIWEFSFYFSKGSRKDLVNQRGIFLTQVICKIWERLIKDRASFATCNINKLQAGSTKNKSTADHTFIIRSCITRAVYLKCSLFLNFYDFRQCFDKLWLEDSVISLYKLGLQNEFLSLIYKTNLEANIVVKPH